MECSGDLRPRCQTILFPRLIRMQDRLEPGEARPIRNAGRWMEQACCSCGVIGEGVYASSAHAGIFLVSDKVQPH
jgi:hypothetical protein